MGSIQIAISEADRSVGDPFLTDTPERGEIGEFPLKTKEILPIRSP